MNDRDALLALLALVFVLALAWIFLVVNSGEQTVNGLGEGLFWVAFLFFVPVIATLLLLRSHALAPLFIFVFAALLFLFSGFQLTYRLQSYAQLFIASLGVVSALALAYFSISLFRQSAGGMRRGR